MEQRAERLRQEEVAKARAFLEQHHHDFHDVMVQIYDQCTEVETKILEDEKKRLSEERLGYLLRFVEIHGRQFLRLVNDPESLKAYTVIINDYVVRTWWQFSGIPIDVIPMTAPFAPPTSAQSRRDRLLKAARDLIMDGHRQIAELRKRVSGKPG